MKVIFNADDFGLTQGVNNGIIKAHQQGVVLS
ncbi:ChbG/HpnK family deacetylase, partial [Vibrio campbellii]